MVLTLLSWFRPPVFPQDEDKTRSALLLNVVLNTFVITLPIVFVGSIIGGNVPRLERVLTILAIAWLTIFGTRLLMLMGRIAMAGIITVLILYVATTLSVY